jgi:hypothetical protein
MYLCMTSVICSYLCALLARPPFDWSECQNVNFFLTSFDHVHLINYENEGLKAYHIKEIYFLQVLIMSMNFYSWKFPNCFYSPRFYFPRLFLNMSKMASQLQKQDPKNMNFHWHPLFWYLFMGMLATYLLSLWWLISS